MFFRHFNDPDRERCAHEGFGQGRQFGRHWRGGFGSREGRMFDSGDLKLVILALVAEKPRHGYEIIKDLGERVGGGYSPSPGVVYPTLTLIEDMGYATAAQDQGGRKLYTLTAEGEAFLAANRAQIDAIFARLDGAEGGRRGDIAPLFRAMQNLRMTLRLRIRRHDATPAQIQAIADALDAAAKAIERT
ncbi:MAG: PadR family transcriptional regulator [Roseiarcus sp.]|jgi:DNA-binding PadR family transcriptional regulator